MEKEKTIHTEFSKDGFEGWFYPAEGSDRCIILLLGSKGNDAANKALARWVNKSGCAALGFGKWQDPEESDGISEWPLERFGKALDWLKAEGITKFGVMGVSMGGNMALLAASFYSEFSLTIALEAIDVVMEGFEEGKKEGMTEWCTGKSSYTWRGKPLPWQSYHLTEHEYFDTMQKSSREHHEVRSLELYTSLKDVPPECFIPIERIGGRLLIIAAGDDVMWESGKYARRMRERLKETPHRSRAAVKIFPYGTHLLIPYSAGKIAGLDLGGLVARVLFRSGRKNAAACRKSRKQLDGMLVRELGKW